MLEKEIEKAVCDYAKSKNVWVRKFLSPANTGCPDRIFITQTGKVFFIEFKSKGKKLTEKQEIIRKEIVSRKIRYFVCDNIIMGKFIIDKQIEHETTYLPN